MTLYRLYLLDEHRHALMSKPQKGRRLIVGPWSDPTRRTALRFPRT
jgi:hypothetical protein